LATGLSSGKSCDRPGARMEGRRPGSADRLHCQGVHVQSARRSRAAKQCLGPKAVLRIVRLKARWQKSDTHRGKPERLSRKRRQRHRVRSLVVMPGGASSPEGLGVTCRPEQVVGRHRRAAKRKWCREAHIIGTNSDATGMDESSGKARQNGLTIKSAQQ